jgi:Uma2 family endonuclease
MGNVLQGQLTPAKHRLNVGEYYRMAEAGILKPDQRVELIDGEIYDMNPIGSPDAGVTNRLVQRFAQAVADGLLITSVQNPIHLDDYSEPQPDFMVLSPRPDAYGASHPRPADVLLLVEVSDSSIDHDVKNKLPRYAKAEVCEVWIVDLARRSISVCRDPQNGRYCTIYRKSKALSPPCAFPKSKST